MANKKERLDKVLVDRGLISTRARAQAMILAGSVLVNDQPVLKAGTSINHDAKIRLREAEIKYVSRGALKLNAALDQFQVKTKNIFAIDIGASTGGFTEVLLERGAKEVVAVDVGTNQLAYKIRSDPRVKVFEQYNARHLKKENFDREFDLLVMDVSFISIRLIIPAVLSVLSPTAELIVLFKPQFEVGREWVMDGGIVTDQKHAKQVLEETVVWAKEYQLDCKSVMDSPVLGTDGNREYLIHWHRFRG